MGIEIAGEMAKQGRNEGLQIAAQILKGAAARVWDGKSRCNQIDRHIAEVLRDMAAQIESCCLP